MRRSVLAVGLVFMCVFSTIGVGACFASIDRSKIVDDAAADVDAGSTVTDALPADASPACVGASLCDDFERTDILGPWSTLTVDRGGAAQLSSAQAHGGQKSLAISLLANTSAGAYLVSKPQIMASRSDLDYAIFVPDIPDRASINVMALTFGYADRSVDVYLAVREQSSLVAFLMTERASGTADVYDTLVETPLVTNRWVDVEIEIQHTATPAVATLTYDGKVVADAIPLPLALPPGVPSLTAGVNYGSTGSAATLYFDDVRLYLAP